MPESLLLRILHAVLHGLTVLLLPPLLPGLIARVKAVIAGRKGPPLLQLYYDLAKLFRKEVVFSRTTTWVFLAGPVAVVATGWLAATLVPFGHRPSPVHFDGDLILFAYLLALGRFLTVLSALDTGSSFEGMGAAREVAFSALAEPALFLGLATLAKLSGSISLSGLLGAGSQGWSRATGPLVLVMAGWLIVYLVENSRIPVDDPNTHLELTMIHEVMVLDHSGPPFGLVLYGASLKLLVLGALLVDLILPGTGRGWLDWLAFLGAIGVLCGAVGLVEASMARFRMTRVPQFLVAGVLASAFAFLLLLV
ncbi:MAG TPA: NADH-quinone oxidoreductase subunit H [Holophagaceae bacterium]|nr:NADH-quinone oxidoreductase subunit H [Holophagaceae bacterium]